MCVFSKLLSKNTDVKIYGIYQYMYLQSNLVILNMMGPWKCTELLNSSRH